MPRATGPNTSAAPCQLWSKYLTCHGRPSFSGIPCASHSSVRASNVFGHIKTFQQYVKRIQWTNHGIEIEHDQCAPKRADRDRSEAADRGEARSGIARATGRREDGRAPPPPRRHAACGPRRCRTRASRVRGAGGRQSQDDHSLGTGRRTIGALGRHRHRNCPPDAGVRRALRGGALDRHRARSGKSTPLRVSRSLGGAVRARRAARPRLRAGEDAEAESDAVPASFGSQGP